MLGVSREAAMQTCHHSTLLDFVVVFFTAEYVPYAGDYRGSRFTCPSISFCIILKKAQVFTVTREVDSSIAAYGNAIRISVSRPRESTLKPKPVPRVRMKEHYVYSNSG
jgi:hypothetical protein